MPHHRKASARNLFSGLFKLTHYPVNLDTRLIFAIMRRAINGTGCIQAPCSRDFQPLAATQV